MIDILDIESIEVVDRCEAGHNLSGYNLSGLDHIDPDNGFCGKYYDPDGMECEIRYDDELTYRTVNEQKTDTIFQFDTSLAKRILSDASAGQGINSPHQLILLNALGHPGPMQSIPDVIANRDDPVQSWKENLRNRSEIMYEILKDTFGVCVYQEQLTQLWQLLAGFTATEAQTGRKDIAKKRVHKLKQIEERWLIGASKTLGDQFAKEYWSVMETFGRYAFNKSHAVAYAGVVAYRCLWFKTHFFPEWIASVLNSCHMQKIPRYIAMAKSEGWKPTHITAIGKQPPDGYSQFRIVALDVNNLNPVFSVVGNVLIVGLLLVKGIGESVRHICDVEGPFDGIDDFIARTGAGKAVIERLIKLGAFSQIEGHHNRQALWQYYAYKYKKFDAPTRSEIKIKILEHQGWTITTIAAERDRQIAAYKEMYPNKKERNYPKKVTEWVPTGEATIQDFNEIYDDYKVSEIIAFEEQYLGYNLSNPMMMYKIRPGNTIDGAIENHLADLPASIDVIITDVVRAVTSNDNVYCRLEVTDGTMTTSVFLWSDVLERQNPALLRKGSAVTIPVKYQYDRKSFTATKSSVILPLERVD